MTTITISGRGLLREYNALKAKGYTTLWSGNGQICMQAPPDNQTPPDPPKVVTEQQYGKST